MKPYTIDGIYNLPEDRRAESMDGQIFGTASQNRKHQTTTRQLFSSIDFYIRVETVSVKLFCPDCIIFNGNDTNYVEPDMFVPYDQNKRTGKGCKEYNFSGSVEVVIYGDVKINFSGIDKIINIVRKATIPCCIK